MPAVNKLIINRGKVLPDFFMMIYDDVGGNVRNFLNFPTVPRVTSDTANPNWMEWQIPTSTEGSRYWLYTGTRVVSFEVKFWAYNDAFNDVIVPARWIRSLQYPVSIDGDPKRPPLCLINMGKWLTMMGVVGNVGVAYNTNTLLDGASYELSLPIPGMRRLKFRTQEQEEPFRIGSFSGDNQESVGINVRRGSVPVEATVTFQLTSFRKANPAASIQAARDRVAANTSSSGASSATADNSTIRFTMAQVMAGEDEKRFV